MSSYSNQSSGNMPGKLIIEGREYVKVGDPNPSNQKPNIIKEVEEEMEMPTRIEAEAENAAQRIEVDEGNWCDEDDLEEDIRT